MHEFGQIDPSKCTPTGGYTGDKKVMAGYMHSITSTENFIILPVTSTLINPCRFLQPPPDPQSDIMPPNPDMFYRDVPLRFLVFNKRTKKFETSKPLEAYPAMWISHQFNAFEKPDGTLIADMIAYDRGNIYSRELNADIRKREVYPAISRLLRFTLDLRNKRVKYDYLIPQEQISAEFPQFNHNFEGKQYKWGYLVISPYAAGSQVMKLDMEDPTGRGNSFFAAGNNIAVSEPWFVPKPGSQQEDDGLLLVRGLDTSTKKSMLFVVNAQTMQETGRADAPIAVPFGFHNRYYSKREIGLPPGYKPKTNDRKNPDLNNNVIQPFMPPSPPNPVPLQPEPYRPRPVIPPGPYEPRPINPLPNTTPSYPGGNGVIPPIPQPPEIPNTIVINPEENNNNFGGNSLNGNENNMSPDNNRITNRNNNRSGFNLQQIVDSSKNMICSFLRNIKGIKDFCNSKS